MTTDAPRGLPTRYRRIGSSALYEGVEYKDFWDGESRKRLDKLEHALVCSLLPRHGQRLIDIGCGYGRLSDCYLERFDQVVMLDGSMTLLQQAKEITQGRAFYVAADVYHLPFKDSTFDCTLMIRVFQHLSCAEDILLEIRRILQKSGVFIFNYCNKRSLRQLLKWVFRKKLENPLKLNPDNSAIFLISHHPVYVDQFLQNAGFSQTEFRGEGIVEEVIHRNPSIRKDGNLIDSLVSSLGRIKMAPWIMCKASAQILPDPLKDQKRDPTERV